MIAVFFKLLLVFSALAGFLLTLYISHKKHAHETMVCPIGGHCESVIQSKYSQFFGIPIEWIGLFYYGIIALSYITIFVAPGSVNPLIRLLLILFTITAFLFSVYLTCLQAFTLREWCTLCLTSAFLCTIIFVSSLFTSEQSFVLLLAQYAQLITTVHVVAFALGLGTVTITDILFIKFLSDFRISESEYGTLMTLSEIMWLALAVIILSGVGEALVFGMPWISSPAIGVALISILVVMCSGVLLNLVVMPRLIHISFREKHQHEQEEFFHIHKIAFMIGAISLLSWYISFILSVTPGVQLSFWSLLFVYIILLVIAGCAGNLLEYMLLKRRAEKS